MEQVPDVIIMFLGDTHGNRGFTLDAIRVASSLGVDRLIQVGDFGYWPSINGGQKFLGEVGRAAVKARMPFYWLAGNHEDHDHLDEMVAAEIVSKDLDPALDVTPFIHGQRISHVRSGARWEWDGVTFGAIGGAFSIDRQYRTKHSQAYGWFPQEVPDASLIPGLGHVDVLVTHEAPIVPPELMSRGHFRIIEESAMSQRAIFDALESARPDYLVHGHWHHRETYMVMGAQVWGLDCDLSVMNAACVYDTEHRKMYSLGQWVYARQEEGHGEGEAPQYRSTR